jgi:hypothetical protein
VCPYFEHFSFVHVTLCLEVDHLGFIFSDSKNLLLVFIFSFSCRKIPNIRSQLLLRSVSPRLFYSSMINLRKFSLPFTTHPSSLPGLNMRPACSNHSSNPYNLSRGYTNPEYQSLRPNYDPRDSKAL